MNLHYLPPGVASLRTLCEREHSLVRLVEGPRDGVCVLKTVRLSAELPSDLALRLDRLAEASQTPEVSLMPLMGHGIETASNVAWWLMPAADGVNSERPASRESWQTYTPQTLQTRLQQEGPLPLPEVVNLGLQLAHALETLQRMGLAGQGLRADSILVWEGRLRLAGYTFGEAALEAASHAPGDGLRPRQQAQGNDADWFALGRTLYSAWTGCQAREFPSLPLAVLNGVDWHPAGMEFNRFLIRWCSDPPPQKHLTTGAFSEELRRVTSREWTLPRRQWMTGLGISAAAVGLWMATRRRSGWTPRVGPVAHWTLLKRWDHLPDKWSVHELMTDPSRDRLLSFESRNDVTMLYQLNLESYDLEVRMFPDLLLYTFATTLVPGEEAVWVAAKHLRSLHALSVHDPKPRLLGTSPATAAHIESEAYWNPITQRFGVGFGRDDTRAHNGRWEWDGNQWLEVEASNNAHPPNPRSKPYLIKRSEDTLILCGGMGSRAVVPGTSTPRPSESEGHFQLLSDVWELDLKTGTWRAWNQQCDLSSLSDPSLAFDTKTARLFAIDRCPEHKAIGTPPQLYVAPAEGNFQKVRSVGNVPGGHSRFLLAYDQLRSRMLAFCEDGIYGVQVDPG